MPWCFSDVYIERWYRITAKVTNRAILHVAKLYRLHVTVTREEAEDLAVGSYFRKALELEEVKPPAQRLSHERPSSRQVTSARDAAAYKTDGD